MIVDTFDGRIIEHAEGGGDALAGSSLSTEWEQNQKI
jgi:hypothetical protein